MGPESFTGKGEEKGFMKIISQIYHEYLLIIFLWRMFSLQNILKKLESIKFAKAVADHREITASVISDFSSLTFDDLRVVKDSLKPGKNGEWIYVPVRETPAFTLALFSLPLGCQLPLHNHPNMSVVMKLLSGSLLVNSAPIGNHSLSLGQVVDLEQTLTSSILTLSSDVQKVDGVHEIIAVENSVFIDLVTPPYGEGRNIQYFERVDEHGKKLKVIPEPTYNRGINRRWMGV